MAARGGRYFCSAGRGLEPFLAREVRARLGATEVRGEPAPVPARGGPVRSGPVRIGGEGDLVRFAPRSRAAAAWAVPATCVGPHGSGVGLGRKGSLRTVWSRPCRGQGHLPLGQAVCPRHPRVS